MAGPSSPSDRPTRPRKVCYFAGTAGDWGGASRVLFTMLGLLDRSRFAPVVLLSGAGPAERLLTSLAIPCVVWGPVAEPRGILGYLKAIIRAVRWYRRHEIDLIHMNRANDWRPAEHLAARLLGIPIVTHFHLVNQDRSPAVRMSRAIAAVSAYVAQHSDCQGVPVTVIHNTVSLERFGAGRFLLAELGLSSEQVVVTFIGQIRAIKGIVDFVAMARRVAGDKVRFLIAGQCRDQRVIGDALTEEELRGLIACDSRIQYCGYVTNIQDILETSHILVVPSLWEEPFGLVLIEAGAARKPVVATRVGGIPEVVQEGVTGFLVNPGDVDGLAEHVRRLVADPQLRKSMGEAGRARVEWEFTTRPVRELEALYERLLHKPF